MQFGPFSHSFVFSHFYPGTVQDILGRGEHAWASRVSILFYVSKSR